MGDATQPFGPRELPLLLQQAKRMEIFHRIPQPQTAPIVGEGLLLTSGKAIVDEQRQVEARRRHQAIRLGEPGIAFNELELAVTRIAFELDVAQSCRTRAACKNAKPAAATSLFQSVMW